MSAVVVGATLFGVTPVWAVSNGDDVTGAPPWAAYVTTVKSWAIFQTTETNCSGTIVAKQWVLTAAHCAVKENAQGVSTSTPRAASDFRVVLGRGDLSTNQGAQWTVDSVLVLPTWDPTKVRGDVALLHLKGALASSAAPLPLAPPSFALPDNQAVTSYGYGNVSESQPTTGSYVGKSSKYLRVTRPGSYKQSTACTLDTNWCMHLTGASQILHGDSGGPWVVDDSNPYLIGVTSVNTDPLRTSRDQITWRYHLPARVSAPDIHEWVRSKAGIIKTTPDTIYRDQASGSAWLMESDGFRHSIPDGGTYLCLTGRGHPVVNLDAFTLAEIPKADSAATCSSTQGDVLLYGDGDFTEDTSGFANLDAALTAKGFHVTSLAGQTSLPSDLSSFGQVWHYGIDVPSSADQQSLITFAKHGHGVFLTGERPCCETENVADASIINALIVTVGGIDVGGMGDIGSCSDDETINQGAVDGVATRPNVLTTWHPVCPGGLGNVSPENIFATSPSGKAVGAVWDDDDVVGGGRIAILMDVNWAQTRYWSPATMPPIAQNLATFLAGR